jgi:hypothetical protein
MIRLLIMWMVRRTKWWARHPLTQFKKEGKRIVVARRLMPFFEDEIQRGDDTIHRALPWYAPFNALLHCWFNHDDNNQMHDHPRWTLTVCLKGELIEKTPWGDKVLRPGSIVFRSPKYIHGFRVAPEHSARTWTLFIVGRRRFCQNTYEVTRQTEAADRRGK